MSKATTEQKKSRTRYSRQYKDEALASAERVGISRTAAQWNLKEPQLYAWRTKARQGVNTGEREQQLVNENIPRKRQPAEQAEKLVLVKSGFQIDATHLGRLFQRESLAQSVAVHLGLWCSLGKVRTSP
ncbi:transposase [Aeromonas salmonicida]|uniref:transposase n=1 Tax=Aeromonas salmonicida TaxID=645 RepID=UPI003D039323